MSCGRSEQAGLCGLGKQVTEAKQEPLGLRRKKARLNTALPVREGAGGGGSGVLQRESVCWGEEGWGKVRAHCRDSHWFTEGF